ncbi:MAG: nucleotide exchange factor GrpE [Coriobacteriaceae bacterium]|nr:nucleotide exchange factor GrpE [Coriobacteriaceae bacterium]
MTEEEKNGQAAEPVEPETAEGAADVDAAPASEQDIEDAIGAEADEAVAGVESESEELAKAKQEVADWQNKYLRLHAEWDTYRRRMNEQREQEKARATEKLVGDLLPVLDDFERTIDYAEKNGTDNLLGGVEAVYAKLVNTLTTDGVEVIDPAGEPFDALQHQAVATVPDTETYDETVAAVYQKGYKMGGKVLRPAMVTVTTGGPKRPAEDEGAEE